MNRKTDSGSKDVNLNKKSVFKCSFENYIFLVELPTEAKLSQQNFRQMKLPKTCLLVMRITSANFSCLSFIATKKPVDNKGRNVLDKRITEKLHL